MRVAVPRQRGFAPSGPFQLAFAHSAGVPTRARRTRHHDDQRITSIGVRETP
jgi:hypothetical protein